MGLRGQRPRAAGHERRQQLAGSGAGAIDPATRWQRLLGRCHGSHSDLHAAKFPHRHRYLDRGPGHPRRLGGFDDPIAIAPNGTVLFSARQTLDGTFLQPPSYFEYDPSTILLSTMMADPGVQRTPAGVFEQLPGVARRRYSPVRGPPPTLYHESAGTGPEAAWAPTISSVTSNSDGTFTLTGTQLNGISEGSTYGDDAENATNFPLVQFTDAAGAGAFGRTFNWTSTGVATGTTPVSTDFMPPSNLNSDDVYQLQVIANGIASKPDLFLETGPTDQSVTLQTDPANGDYQFLVNGESVGEYAPGSFSGVVLSLEVATLKVSIRGDSRGRAVTVVGNLFYNTTINIGDATGVQNILGNVLLVSPGDFNTINVSDVGDSTGRYVTLSTTSDASGNDYGTITGLARPRSPTSSPIPHLPSRSPAARAATPSTSTAALAPRPLTWMPAPATTRSTSTLTRLRLISTAAAATIRSTSAMATRC